MPKNPALKWNDTRREEKVYKYSLERDIRGSNADMITISSTRLSQGRFLWTYDAMRNSNLVFFHCFTVHFVSLSFIYTNVCTCF